jgi:hypothetical protein
LLGASTVDLRLLGATLLACKPELAGDRQHRDGDDDEARAVHNRSIDRRRGAIARCTDVADVIWPARGRRWCPCAVVGTMGAGLGVCDDGLVIDLSSIGFGTNTSCYRDHFSCWLSGRGRRGGELTVDPTPKSGA